MPLYTKLAIELSVDVKWTARLLGFQKHSTLWAFSWKDQQAVDFSFRLIKYMVPWAKEHGSYVTAEWTIWTISGWAPTVVSSWCCGSRGTMEWRAGSPHATSMSLAPWSYSCWQLGVPQQETWEIIPGKAMGYISTAAFLCLKAFVQLMDLKQKSLSVADFKKTKQRC